MNFVDLLIIIPAAWFAFKGFKNGFIMEVASVLSLFIGIWATMKFSPAIASQFGDSKTVYAVTFVLLFFAVLLGVHFAALFASKIVKLLIGPILDHLAGLLFGLAKVALIFSVIFFFINKIDTDSVFFKKEAKENSLLYQYVEPIAPAIFHLKQ